MSPASLLRVALAATLLAGVGLDARRGGADAALVVGERAEVASVQLYVMTDRPLYRPGETVWFRVWQLGSGDLAPDGAGAVRAELVDPRGATVIDKKLRVEAGAARSDLVLPAGLAGGRYTLRLSAEHGGRDERELVVSSYEVPRLKKRIELLATSYRPGAVVTGALSVQRADGTPAAGARLTAIAWVDGQTVHHEAVRADRRGGATVRFSLPARIERGDALLTVTVEDGGAVEVVQRRIPIALDAAVLAVFPEGGDLVAGLPARVYLAARSPAGEPIAVRGEVRDDLGAVVARFDSALRGMARFELTPAAGRRYRAVVTSPVGAVELPAAREVGCTLTDAGGAADAIAARVACTADSDVAVVVALRGVELGRRTTRTGTAGTVLSLPTGGRSGAFRVTLLDARGTPVAERLVARGLGRALRVAISPTRDRFAPRDEVELAIETRDADGRPVAADLALAVVDDAVLGLADDRGRNLLAELWLEPEMPGQRIEDPGFYLAATPEAIVGLDLLLGTAGWRRFRLAR